MTKLVTVFLALTCGASWAAPVTWTLTDVVLRDGGTVTGSFVYDADTDTYDNIFIFYDNANGYGDYDFRDTTDVWYDGDTYSPNSNDAYFYPTDVFPDDFKFLWLQFVSPLTNNGGEIALDTLSGLWTQAVGGGGSLYPNNTLAVGLGASVTASVVPLPAAVWLFGSALAGLGWMRRKQTA